MSRERKALEMWVLGFMHGKTRDEALDYIAEQQRIDPDPEFWNIAEGYIRAAYPERGIKTYRAWNRRGRAVRVTIPQSGEG